jgi:hypothetical protein
MRDAPPPTRSARVALFILLVPMHVALALASELGVLSDAARELARAYAALALRLVAYLFFLASVPFTQHECALSAARARRPRTHALKGSREGALSTETLCR